MAGEPNMAATIAMTANVMLYFNMMLIFIFHGHNKEQCQRTVQPPVLALLNDPFIDGLVDTGNFLDWTFLHGPCP